MYNEGFLIYYECCSREAIDNAVNRYAALQVIKSKMIKAGTPEDHLPKNLNALPGQVEFAYYRSYEK